MRWIRLTAAFSSIDDFASIVVAGADLPAAHPDYQSFPGRQPQASDHMRKTEITGPKRGSVQTEQTLGTLPDDRCSRLPGSNGQRASTHGG